MRTTYKSTVFAWFYIGALLLVAIGWLFLPEVPSWGAGALAAFGLLTMPLVWVKVEISDEGITQQSLRRQSVRWTEILSWRRVARPDSDGPDTIIIVTQSGSFALNHNCVYGKRLDFIESELRRRCPSSR